MSAPQHIMVDLETLDTTATGVILSIGATRFDRNGLIADWLFYTTLDIDQQLHAGRTVSGNTFKWWLGQNEAARNDIASPSKPTKGVVDALTAFSEWCLASPFDGIWGYGAEFDNAMLANLYRTFGLQAPWMHWQSRCYRTLKGLHPDVDLPERVGTHHNALHDAVHQARGAAKLLALYDAH